MRLFIGIECEGALRGAKTLFVEGLVPLPTIREFLLANSDVTQVYFGAGKRDGDPSVVRVHDAAIIASMFSGHVVTIETNMDLLAFEAMERHNNIWLMIPVVSRTGFKAPNTFLDYMASRPVYAKKRTQIKILGNDFTCVVKASDFAINARSEVKADVTVWTADDSAALEILTKGKTH